MVNSIINGSGASDSAINNFSKPLSKSTATFKGSHICHLTDKSPGWRQSRVKAMQEQINDAANMPSTSKNPRYTSLVALKERQNMTAPESKIRLSGDRPGLLGGAGSSSEANKNITKQIEQRETKGKGNISKAVIDSNNREVYDRFLESLAKDMDTMKISGYSEEQIRKQAWNNFESWGKG